VGHSVYDCIKSLSKMFHEMLTSNSWKPTWLMSEFICQSLEEAGEVRAEAVGEK
jgi:hypothetical protein